MGTLSEAEMIDNKSETVKSISIGVCVYNEEKNIGRLLTSLHHQTIDNLIKEIIVVSSGSTDKTNEIVTQFTQKDARVKLVTEHERKGKASAINIFLKKASENFIVLISGDVLPNRDALEYLIEPFSSDHSIGMTGGKVIPTNKGNFLSFAVYLIWNLHHRIAYDKPKLGEMVAFRNIIKEIDENTAVDEAWIEYLIMQKGFKLQYTPKAVVYNRGPETVQDFLKQRKRIYTGHLDLEKRTGYVVSSMNFKLLVGAIVEEISQNPFKIHWIIVTGALELIARILGFFNHLKKKNPYKWDIVESTKEVR